MKAGYVIRDQEKPHFITITVVDWIDIFTRKPIATLLLKTVSFGNTIALMTERRTECGLIG